MLHLMTADILEVIRYIPHGILLGGFIVLCVACLQYIGGHKIVVRRLFYIGMFLIYFIVVLKTAFFSREPGSRVGEIDWRILPNWQTAIWVRTYALENIIMFIPFGILVPLFGRWAKKFYVCIPLAMLLSIGIEASQYGTQRGFCQLEDLVMNTIGAVLGYGIWFLSHQIVNRITRGKEDEERKAM